MHYVIPGRGNTGIVSNCSYPPIVVCESPICHPWPVCWLMNWLWRKGFVLPVGFGRRGAAAGGCRPCWGCCMVEMRANGLVPVR